MTKSSLFKFQTVVVQLLFTATTVLFSAPRANAELSNSDLATLFGNKDITNICNARITNLKKNASQFTTNCNSGACVSKQDDCAGTAKAQMLLVKSDDEKCSAINLYCPSMLRTDDSVTKAADNMDLIRKRARDARKDLLQATSDARKDSTSNMEDMQKAMNDGQKAQQDAQKDYKASLKAVKEQKAKAVQDAQAGFDSINKNMVDLRADLRNGEAEIKTVEEQKAVNCLADAEAAAQSKENEQKLIEANRQRAFSEGARERNRTSTGAATKSSRKKRYRVAVLLAYKNALAKCTAGAQGSGLVATNKLIEAKNKQMSKNLHAQDLEGLMNSQRQQILGGLSSAQTQADEDTAQAKQDLSQAQQNAQQQMMQGMINAQTKQAQSVTPEQKIINQELKDEYDSATQAYQDAKDSADADSLIPKSCGTLPKESATAEDTRNSLVRSAMSDIALECSDTTGCTPGAATDMTAVNFLSAQKQACSDFYTRNAKYFSEGNYTNYVSSQYTTKVKELNNTSWTNNNGEPPAVTTENARSTTVRANTHSPASSSHPARGTAN